MSIGSGKDSTSSLPSRDSSASQSGSRTSRKSFAKTRANASVDHRPGTVLPLQVKQKGRSTSIDVNAQNALQRTPFITRNPSSQRESGDYRKYGREDVSRQVLPPLGDDVSFEASNYAGHGFDIQMSSPRRTSVTSLSSVSSSPEKRASQRLDWCRESLTPRFNHLASILEGRSDPPPPVPRFAGSAVASGKGKTKQA